MTQAGDLIIVGASARAAAISALRAGFRPHAVDLFADRDLARIATVIACPPADYPLALPSLVARLPAGPLLLTGAMENHPAVAAALAQSRPLAGPSPTAMRALRELPWQPPDTLPRIEGVGWCQVHDPTALSPSINATNARWIIKPRRSAGGARVRLWEPGDPPPMPDECAQRYITGLSLGVLWRSHQSRCRLLGASVQILGDAAFGATGHRYVGSLGPYPLTPAQQAALTTLGQQLTDDWRIAGLWGADVILDDQSRLWPVEFNPRYTASVEILEKAGLFAALDPASVPTFQDNLIHGKAIVFATHDLTTPDLYDSFEPGQIADVPPPGQRIDAGRPICTVLATGQDRPSCLARLRKMACRVYTRLRDDAFSPRF